MKQKTFKRKGLYKKYNIYKNDGRPVDRDAEYFVLRLDSLGNDPIHVEASRKAVLVYADEIKDYLPELSNELKEKYGTK